MIAQVFSTEIVDLANNPETIDKWVTLLLMALPFVTGFSIYLLPKLDRALALLVTLCSFAYALWRLVSVTPLSLQLLDSFGVTLVADTLSGYFILTNALVAIAVIFYCWSSHKSAFFYTQVTILHGSVNAVFICTDLISLYVALEVISIAAFLLIAYPQSNRSIWVALRYLFMSNTAMLFYLIGAVLVYQTHRSFSYNALQDVPPEAIALICLGLLTKGGVFVSGLWLPLTHAESETPVSALLSGVVIKTGVFPLIRFALLVPDFGPILQLFSIGTAILGVSGAILASDTKRLLAFSTISQMGFVLSAPAMAGFYALTHGLAKAALFLTASKLPSRDFKELQTTPLKLPLWIAITIPSLSISGLPLLAGFEAKTLTLKALAFWPGLLMSLAAVGTAIVFARLIFLPFNQTRNQVSDAEQTSGYSGFWLALTVLVGGLVLSNQLSGEVYQLANLAKALITIGAGWGLYLLLGQRNLLRFPVVVERLEHLVGGMTLVLIFLFWMAVA